MADDAVEKLVAVLRETKARPRLSPEQVVRSSMYDPVYRACVIGLCLRSCGKHDQARYSMNYQKLHLFQFMAVHRALLRPFQEWVGARHAGNLVPLEHWARLPSGYASDRTHQEVLAYLVATGQLRTEGTHVIWPESDSGTYLWSLVNHADKQDLFVAERTVLSQLAITTFKLKVLNP